ncbi:alpha/beta hydrolase fold domain-containing protein [Dactylosporangium sp. CA-092794]|uniref:alpha/beta hydrolase fold domain-containing protein n=1 Tax=Dactylosporangium sp. CA-092794 TaxID=3239929 RepID=UPI003D8E0D6E
MTGARPPAPVGLSEPARRALDALPPVPVRQPEPDLADTQGWLRWIETREAGGREMLAPLMPPEDRLARTRAELNGVPTYILRPDHVTDDGAAPVVIEMHGGALVTGGGDLAWMMTAGKAMDRAAVTWVPDYRMPPLHPYPAALDDCLAVYRHALTERPPGRILVSGLSAGGNLAAALLLRAGEERLPMPAALVLLTPQLDLTESGDSFRTNDGIDVLGPLMPMNRLYANGHDLADPHLSPLFGDVTGFPPTFLQTGTRDLFLSNTVRMHRKLLAAGVTTELHVFEAMPHGGFGGNTPEDADLAAEVRRFEDRHLDQR